MNSKFGKKSLDAIYAHWFLLELRHAIFFALGGHHCIIIASEGTDVGRLHVVLSAELVDSSWGFEAVHHGHAAVHEHNLESVHIAFSLIAIGDLLLNFINAQLASIDSDCVNLKFDFNHGLHSLKVETVVVNNQHLRLSWNSLNLGYHHRSRQRQWSCCLNLNRHWWFINRLFRSCWHLNPLRNLWWLL